MQIRKVSRSTIDSFNIKKTAHRHLKLLMMALKEIILVSNIGSRGVRAFYEVKITVTESSSFFNVFVNHGGIILNSVFKTLQNLRLYSNDNYHKSGFFRMYPISALFATSPESRRIKQRKFDTYATVTHSRISNRVHSVSKPYRPRFSCIDPHRNLCQFLRIP
jgi:hypothetical protein